MPKIPRDKNFDSTLAILREGYNFTPNRFTRNKSNVFATRLMLVNKAIFITGSDAAEMFYTSPHLMRKTALPKPIQKTLSGVNGVQTIDPPEHTARKSIFMSLMTKENIQNLLEEVSRNLEAYKSKWPNRNGIKVFDEMREILCLSACNWAGVPLNKNEAKKRAVQFTHMFEGFGGMGPRHFMGRIDRKKTEKWIAEIIEDTRNGKLQTKEGTALAAFASHRELDKKTAAVDLINVVRPITAIATYISFAMHALHKNPEWKTKLADDKNAEIFAHELRRFYPFAPFLGMRVKDDFEWQGYHFKKGSLVMLDVYFMHHDPSLWTAPNEFRPDRFLDKEITPYNFIPQGGGSFLGNHRCAGEWITIEIVKLVLKFMAKTEYEVPRQNMEIDLTRIPTRVKSGFIISKVK